MKKSLIKIIKIFGVGLTVLYPFIVFFALKQHIALRLFALFLLLIACISFTRNKNIWLFICVLLCCIGLVIYNNDIFLKLYPVLMNTGMCLMFALSLRNTPLIEKFAKKIGYTIDAKQQKYTRNATIAWSVFMFCLTVISFTTVFLSDEIWTLFNGLISYVLIAMMMCIEFIIHKKVNNANTNK